MLALEQMGLEVVERVSLVIPPTDAARGYLRTKKEKMGHAVGAGVKWTRKQANTKYAPSSFPMQSKRRNRC
jgi:hypothetical protein